MRQNRGFAGTARFRMGAALLALAVVTSACAPQAADQSSELAALTGKWEEALNAGDNDALAALYSEDCVLMPPNAEMVTGKEGAKAAFSEMTAAGLTGELQTIAAVAAGNIGYHSGTYWLAAPDGTVVDEGKYMEAWRKVGGEWKIVSDIWNSDWAPGAGTTTVVATHRVKDGDHWLAAWQGEDGRRSQFAQYGAPNVRVFQNPEQPNTVGLVIDVADMDAFMAFLNSPEGAAAKAEDGVIDQGLMFFSEVK